MKLQTFSVLRILFFLIVIGLMSSNTVLAKDVNLALHKPVTVSSQDDNYPAINITDGQISRNHAWMSHAAMNPPHLVSINLQKYCDVNRIVMYTGIPDAEKKKSEMGQAAGFWSVKNLKLQYWDDANWSDLPKTAIDENRLDTIVFQFSPVLTTFQIRLISYDGEPIRINEIEVYGTEKKNMPLPEISETQVIPSEKQSGQDIHITIHNQKIGKSMKYVGYNQGYFMPGSNVCDWLEYSNVNSLRVWTALNDFVPVAAVMVDEKINALTEFEANKIELRSNPENNRFIHWEAIISNAEKEMSGTNSMVLKYVLEETKRMGIDVVLQINDRNFNNKWSNKWQQWQRFYALAYYAVKTGNVSMFAMQNEPNHRNSGPMTIENYIAGLQIVSDAVRCAVEDVNKIYGKKLNARIVAPVTAGSNVDWWSEIMKNIRMRYDGKENEKDLLDIFSTHSYNLPAMGYSTKVSDIRKVLEENHPLKTAPPIVFTETGRWMNAYLIDKHETMDSPSLFTEWAGEYTNNTLNGSYGMWAFKFANTASGSYPRGIKSGHHFTWQGKRIVEDAYTNVAKGKTVWDKTSSLPVKIDKVCDGNKNDESAWISPDTKDPKYLEIELDKEFSLGGAVIYTGSEAGIYTGPDRIKNLKLQYWTGSEWKDIKETVENNAKYVQLFYIFKTPIKTSKVRFISSDDGVIKVREIKLFDTASMQNIKSSYNISAIQRTGEVVRLFAKGFKEERPILETVKSEEDNSVDAMTAFDAKAGIYYVWLVQRKPVFDNLSIDFSRLNFTKNTRIIAEEVSKDHYGDVIWTKQPDANNFLSFNLPSQSVILLTIPVNGNQNAKKIHPVADATVRGGKFSRNNQGAAKELFAEMNASLKDDNQVTYMQFDLNDINKEKLNAAVLSVHAKSSAESPYRLHVYALENEFWNENDITWENAPNLNREDFIISGAGKTAHFAGEIVANQTPGDCSLDVTKILRNTQGRYISFVFIRELRQLGDDADNGKKLIIDSKESANKPVLTCW